MGTIKRFEDLHAWPSARELTNLIYELTGIGSFVKDFGLRDQIRRAVASIMLNIAEGFDAGSDAKFVQFLGYACRSASETQAALYTAMDQNIFHNHNSTRPTKKPHPVKKQINGLIAYLHKPRSQGIKESSAIYEIILPDDHPDH